MEFTLAPAPRFAFQGPPRGPDTTFDNPDQPIFVFPPLLPVGHAVGLIPGFLRSTSFRLRPSIPAWALTFTPFTVAVARPGFIHVVADTYFYWGSHLALDALREWARTDLAWGQKTRDELLYDSLQQYLRDKPNLFGPGGEITIVVEVPPAHLVDP